MPIKNFLSPEEKNYLQQALKKENRPEVRERILIFLLENDGKNYQEIAEFGSPYKLIGLNLYSILKHVSQITYYTVHLI